MTPSPKTDWFHRARWGVFTHYLTPPETSADDWNHQVDAFDVETLATQLAAAGAGYYFITLGQGSGHYCAPNAAYEQLAGTGKCARRDLVSDLHAALSRRNIPLLLYVPADGSNGDPHARAALGMTAHWHDENWQNLKWERYRWPQYMRNWEAVCREWSLRWGDKVRGWWVDGAYEPQIRYPENETPNLRTFGDALRAGNPDALVAFNNGVAAPLKDPSPHDDYTPGEIDRCFPVPAERLHKGKQLHILSYAGKFWGSRVPDLTAEFVIGYTRQVNAVGGVVSWDVPILPSGRLDDFTAAYLRQVGDALSTPAQS